MKIFFYHTKYYVSQTTLMKNKQKFINSEISEHYFVRY